MDGQKTEETKKPEEKSENSDEGDKYETTPIIERAREEREKLEVATKALKEENDRREKIMAKQALGGSSNAGQADPQVTEEQKKKEGAMNFFKGTQIEKAIEKHG